MVAAIADRDSGDADPAGPDRRKRVEQGAKHLRGRKWLAARPPMIEEPAETRRRAKECGGCGACFSEPPQQQSSSFETDQFVVRAVLERVREALPGNLGQRVGVGPPWGCRIGREKPSLHRAKTRHGKALGAG